MRLQGLSKTSFSLRTLNKSLELVAAVAPLVEPVARHDRDLRSQLRRATQSISLNLAEAMGHNGGNARLRLESALGSTYETRACLRIAISWGYLTEQDTTEALALLDETAAMTYRLLHPRR